MEFERTKYAKSTDLFFGMIACAMLMNEKFWDALLDSGASAHMFGHIRFFVPGTLRPCYKRIECADKQFLYSYWMGTVLLVRDPKLHLEDPTEAVVCNDALLVEGISKSLVSVGKLTEDGYSVTFEDHLAIIRSKRDEKGLRKVVYTLQKAVKVDKLYHFPFLTANDTAVILKNNKNQNLQHENDTVAHQARTTPITKQVIHERYIVNHCHEKYVNLIDSGFSKEKLPFCIPCALNLKSKQYKKKTYYPKIKKANKIVALPKMSDPLELMEKALTTSLENTANRTVSEDISEVYEHHAYLRSEVQPRLKLTTNDKPFTAMAMDAKTSPVRSVRNIKYAFVLLCLVSRFCYSLLVEERSAIAEDYVTWAKETYNRTGRFPAVIRLDLAGEHRSGVLLQFFQHCGTLVTFSDTGQSNENSYVERKIGILWHQTKIVLTNCGVPFVYWCYCFAYVTCVSNHIPHRGLGNKRPVDIAGMIAVDAMFRVFGSYGAFYRKIKKDSELTGHHGLFLGFCEKVRGYWFLNLDTKKVEHARTCTTNERMKPMLIARTSMGLPIKVKSWPVIDGLSKEGGLLTLPIEYPSTNPVDNQVEFSQQPTFPFAFTPTAKTLENGPDLGPLNLHQGIPKTSEKKLIKHSHKPKSFNPEFFEPSKPLQASSHKPLSSIRNDSRKINVNITYPPTIQESPSEQDEDDNKHVDKQLYTVKKIVGHRKQKFGPVAERNGYDFRVQWSNGEETFEPRKNLDQCRTVLKQYCDDKEIEPGPMDPVTNRNLESELKEIEINTDGTIDKKHYSEPISDSFPTDNLIDQQKIDAINNPLENLTQQFTDTSTSTEGQVTDTVNIEVPKESLEANSVEITIGMNQHIPSEDLPEYEDPPEYDGQQYWQSYEDLTAHIAAQKIDPPPEYSEHILHVKEDPDDLAEYINMALPTIIEILGEDGSREAPPKTSDDMLDGPRREEYIDAELRELVGIGKHGTAVVVMRPENRTPITCRWVYDIKRNEDNEITLFKARLVAHGFKQIQGVDFDKTFSSTAQMRSFRMTVMLACAFELDLVQWDISNAFLNGVLTEEIYMEYPPGYGGPPNTCLKLLKGLYGLKQASRIWNKKLIAELTKAGLVVCKTEPGMLYHPTKRCFVCLHVDDIITATADPQLRKQIYTILETAFLTKDLGELHQYVGVNVIRTSDTITLDQSAYIERVLQKFNSWLKTKPTRNPNFPEKLSKLDLPIDDDEWEELKKFPYPNIVGSLMYAAVATRPDIIQSVITLSRYMSRWGEKQIKAANQVLKYLRGTYGDKIRYTRPKNFNGILDIFVFSDSDWAGCIDTRRSTVGYIIYMCGGPIAWKSQMKKTLALSSCEAEYMALSEVGREIVWIINFLTEIKVKFNKPRIYCDASSAINWAEDPIEHKRNKHIELQYYYIRDIVAAGKVDIFKVSTTDNVSDPLTKNVTTPIFLRLKPAMMGWEELKIDK
jgi:hypothetical protein